MGWGSASYIADNVADALIETNATDDVTEKVMARLIKSLQDGDWDTEEESLENFSAYPAIVRAFAACGVTLRQEES